MVSIRVKYDCFAFDLVSAITILPTPAAWLPDWLLIWHGRLMHISPPWFGCSTQLMAPAFLFRHRSLFSECSWRLPPREQLCNVDFFGCTNPAPIPFAPVDFQLALLNPLHARKQLWQSSWLNGQALMDLFPDLHKLAWRKNKTVEEFQNQNWTRWLWRMQSVSEMADFVSLWDAVQEILLTDQPD